MHFQLDERRPEGAFVGQRALVPGADLVSDDAPDWIDDMNRDEPIPDAPQPVSVQVAALEAAADRGDEDEVRRLIERWVDTDPYHLTETPRVNAAA